MKIQVGRSEQGSSINRQLTMAATYLLFLEEQLDSDLQEVADRVAAA
jgi:hypothetical protein